MVHFPLLGCSEAIYICRKKNQRLGSLNQRQWTFCLDSRSQWPLGWEELESWSGNEVGVDRVIHDLCVRVTKSVFFEVETPLKLKDKLVPHQSFHRDRYCFCRYSVIFPLNTIWVKLIGHTFRWLVKCYEMCHVWEPNEFPSTINSWHSIHSIFCGLSWNAPKQSLRAP